MVRRWSSRAACTRLPGRTASAPRLYPAGAVQMRARNLCDTRSPFAGRWSSTLSHLTQQPASSSRSTGKVGRTRRGVVVSKYLVVANQTLGGAQLIDEVRRRAAAGPSSFYVVVPNTGPSMPRERLGRRWPRPPRQCRQRRSPRHPDLQSRLHQALTQLRAEGLDARGDLGDRSRSPPSRMHWRSSSSTRSSSPRCQRYFALVGHGSAEPRGAEVQVTSDHSDCARVALSCAMAVRHYRF